MNWISVDNKLPPNNRAVLVMCRGTWYSETSSGGNLDNPSSSMKVICIASETIDTLWADLIIGKEYDCIGEHSDGYLILFDYGISYWYPKTCFITINEYRNEKLEELGI